MMKTIECTLIQRLYSIFTILINAIFVSYAILPCLVPNLHLQYLNSILPSYLVWEGGDKSCYLLSWVDKELTRKVANYTVSINLIIQRQLIVTSSCAPVLSSGLRLDFWSFSHICIVMLIQHINTKHFEFQHIQPRGQDSKRWWIK